MRFTAGERVRVKPFRDIDKQYGDETDNMFCDYMKRFCGKEVTIHKRLGFASLYYEVVDDEHRACWHEKIFE